MVVGDFSVQEIAEYFGIAELNVQIFEKLYFDVRPYLGNRAWLQTFCFSERGHRWLRVAFSRGRSGAEEVILRRNQGKKRDFETSLSILQGRIQDICFDLEANNVAPGENDLKLALMLSRIAALGQLPDLINVVEVPETPVSKAPAPPVSNALASLPIAGQDRVASFLSAWIRKIKEKGIDRELAQKALERMGQMADDRERKSAAKAGGEKAQTT
jgi:hypothetical protein